MQHKGTKLIETKRLILRPFSVDDASAAFKNWTSDDKVTQYLTWPTHENIGVTETVLRDWVEKSKNKDFYQWAIVLKEIEEPIGSISVVDIDEKVNIVHIGYCIGSKWWHKGITTEAFSAIIPFLFDEVGVNRIESMHDIENPYSGDVMKKCGLSYEGTLRQADYNNRGIVDVCMYSLIRSDWEEGLSRPLYSILNK